MQKNNKNLTPLKSVRRHCLWCCLEQPSEVRLCSADDCEFYRFRFGKKKTKGSVIKIIRKKCLDCGEGGYSAVKNCEFSNCPLFAYRNGKSPAHQRLWRNKSHKECFKKKEGATRGGNDKNMTLDQ